MPDPSFESHNNSKGRPYSFFQWRISGANVLIRQIAKGPSVSEYWGWVPEYSWLHVPSSFHANTQSTPTQNTFHLFTGKIPGSSCFLYSPQMTSEMLLHSSFAIRDTSSKSSSV